MLPVSPGTDPPGQSRVRFPEAHSRTNPAEAESLTSTSRKATSRPTTGISARTQHRHPEHAVSTDRGRPRAPISNTFGSRQARKMQGNRMLPMASYLPEETIGSTDLSDEYDLSQEDPKLFQDIQRALTLKARRDARLNSTRANSPLRSSVPFPDRVSGSSESSVPQILPTETPTPRTDGGSDLDFAPSTSASVALHPVPSSSDDGMTLDWTGRSSGHDKHERRWTLSSAKRKDKGKLLLNTVLMEKQEISYSDKIARIKLKAGSHTLRKAEITSGQLARRYAVLYESMLSAPNPINLVDVARWYDKQPSILKDSIEKAEPFSWLKHLHKTALRGSTRSARYMSALILEEFWHSNMPSGVITETVPEDIAHYVSKPPSSEQGSILSSHVVVPHSRTSITKRRSDENVSFEPVLGSGRPGGNSPRQSVDAVRPWKSLLTHSPSSSRSSIYSISGLRGTTSPYLHRPSQSPHASPASSDQRITGFNNRPSPPQAQSDDGFSSARESIPEKPLRKPGSSTALPQRRPSDLVSKTSRALNRDGLEITISDASIEPDDRNLAQATDFRSGTMFNSERTPHPLGVNLTVPLTGTLGRKTARISSPNPDRLLADQERKRQLDADEQRARREYEVKSQMLDDAVAQNQRTRYMLQRVGVVLKEYDNLQSSLLKSLGLPQQNLPPDLLEAFSHDPSSVTGATRRHRGWRAVEDIQARWTRQREAFHYYASVAQEDGILSTPRTGLEERLARLLQSLEALDSHRTALAAMAHEVKEVLTSIKKVHAAVKADYNSTLSHVSVIYPELSHITGLEESYRDRYKALWDFGMRALTLILDTVVPFWRTYGRTIGDDIRDFLVIPWYRNEYTGEAKWYPIARFPRKSFRHWIALLLFFTISIALALLHARFAISSIMLYRLSWVSHDGLRWMIMPFFWSLILVQSCALALEWSVVVAELGVIVWWLGWLLKINS